MKKNNLIFTIIVSDLQKEISKLTLPLIQRYSKKVGTDLEIIKELNDEYLTQDWHKYKISEYLKTYKRVLFISIDTIIREDSPNLFDIIPENKLSAFNEGRYMARLPYVEQASKFYNISFRDRSTSYYNTNILMASRMHRDLFILPKDFIYIDDVDPYFNLILKANKIEVYNLDWKFNRMEFLDKYVGISRLDSYFINYKGAPNDIVLNVMQKDINQWKEDSPKFEYKRNIIISVSAGMGDQMCSEPVIRYIKKLYPDANVYVVTHHPRLFEHIKEVTVSSYEKWNGIEDAAIMMYPTPEEHQSMTDLSHVLFHPTDFASLSTIKRTLPNNEKTIKLKVEPSDVLSIMEWLKDIPKDKPAIVVHPGKWWPSKTFPVKWWQEVIDKLSKKLTVVLIGKTLTDDQGYQPVNCPDSGYDLRDLTSLGEMIALLSTTRCVLTNDSSPIHLAGAFDNWIVAIPTAKHPDHILPYRNGTQSYKTKTLYKKLLVDDLEIRHTEFYTDTIDMIPKDKTIMDYLPEVDEVVNEILNIYIDCQPNN